MTPPKCYLRDTPIEIIIINMLSEKFKMLKFSNLFFRALFKKYIFLVHQYRYAAV